MVRLVPLPLTSDTFEVLLVNITVELRVSGMMNSTEEKRVNSPIVSQQSTISRSLPATKILNKKPKASIKVTF